MKKIFLMSLIALGGYNFINAQKSTELDFKTPMPPESYQFKKRLINNVSLYTGQPSISIPIYTINLDGLEIPISISYNTGGIKTDEDATFVGLGWSLNIGGEINRTNHGALDENYLISTPYNFHSNGSAGIGFLKTSPTVVNPGNSGSFYDQYCTSGINSQVQEYLNFYKNAYYASDPLTVYESFDARPDEFFYSMPNHSGKIMFSQKSTKFVTIPFDDIKTEYNISSTQNGSYTKKDLDFTFTLSNGYKVNFGRDGVKAMYKLMTGGRLFDQTWQLSSIISPKGNNVLYQYQPIEYQLCTNLNSVSTFISGTTISSLDQAKCNEVSNKDKIPTAIIFPTGKIEFHYNDRLDLMSGSKRLKEIIIYNGSGNQIKKVEFNQSYFEANYDIFTGNPNATNTNISNKRLRLNSVKIINGQYDNPTSNELYGFDYYLFDKIPSKTTKARDHWGYFNGAMFGTYNFAYDFKPKVKSIDNLYSQTFSLKTIKYPEGGKKEFLYESHQAIPHYKIEKYFDEISDDRYALKNNSLIVSGYNLNYLYPTPSNIQLPNYPNGHKVILGNEFEVTSNDKSLSDDEKSIYITSNLPQKHPDYQNINREYNFVSFVLQKKNGSTFQNFMSLGEISKSYNSNGIIEGNLKVNTGEANSLSPGIYRVAMIVYQPFADQYSNSNINHSSNISLKFRTQIKEDGRVGGLRIKQINTYKEDNTIPDYISQYSYTDDNGKSAGKMVNVPDYFEIMHIREPSVTGPANDPINLHKLTIKTSTEPLLPLYKTSGSNVGYTKITKKDIDILSNAEIKESSYFTFQEPNFSDIPLFSLSRQHEPKEWHRGKQLKTQYYKNNQIIKEELFEYNGEAIEANMDDVEEINTDLVDISEFTCNYEPMQSKHIDIDNTRFNFIWTPSSVVPFNLYNPTGHISNTFIPYFKIYSGFDQIKSKISKEYLNGSIITTQENYSYYNDIYKQLEKQNTIFTDNSNQEKSFKYASQTGNQLMIAKNMTGIPLETTTTQTKDGVTKTLARSETLYPTALPTAQAGSLVLPLSSVSYDVLNNTPSTEVSYDKYDDKGNLLQYTGKEGIPVSIVWGYNKTQPIAKIEGMAYDQLMAAVSIAGIVTASDNDAADPTKEGLLLEALNSFRKEQALSGKLISTYTYDPLIGVTSITPPSGVRQSYTYDAAGRLKEGKVRSKDNSGSYINKKVSENNYNYKP